MNFLIPAVIATLVGSLILTFIYSFLYIQEKQRFLSIWAISWLILSFRYGFILLEIEIGNHPWLTIGNHTSSLVSGIFLLWGAYEFSEREFSPWWWLGAIVGFIWMSIAAFTQASVLITTLPTFTYLAGVYIWTGTTLISTPMTSGGSKQLTGWAFIFWGIHKADFPFLRTVTWFAPWGFLLSASLELIVALGMLSVYYDIQRKRLAESEERFHLAVLGSQDGIWDWQDVSQEYYWWSDRIYEILDYEPGAFQPTISFWQENMHPDDRDQSMHALEAHFQNNTPYQVDFRMRQKNGAYMWMYARGASIRDEQGLPIRMAGSVTDITERVRAKAELQERQERYKSLFNSIRDAILVADTERAIINCNPSFVELFEYSLEELKGQQTLTVYENRAQYEELGHNIAQNFGKQNFLYTVNYRKKSGIVFPGETKVFYLKDHDGKTLGFIGLIRDITERVRAEEELEQYREHLEKLVGERTQALEAAHEQLLQQERLSTMGKIAGGIAHEIRNPLGVISNAIYYLRIKQLDGDPTVAEYLALIEKNVKQATQIASGLLDLGRIPTAKQASIQLAAHLAETLSVLPPPPNVDIQYDLPEELPPVLVDPQHLHQVLVNLLNNAYQAMTAGGQVTISARESVKGVKLSIADTGEGIHLADQAKIFEPLFTTKTKGIGLGLPICKQLVEANGGQLEFESKIGVGTTFTISLPFR